MLIQIYAKFRCFRKRYVTSFLHHIFCLVFQGKYFSYNIIFSISFTWIHNFEKRVIFNNTAFSSPWIFKVLAFPMMQNKAKDCNLVLTFFNNAMALEWKLNIKGFYLEKFCEKYIKTFWYDIFLIKCFNMNSENYNYKKMMFCFHYWEFWNHLKNSKKS